MGFIQKINLLWQQLGLVHKALLAAAVMTCIFTAILLTRWATEPEFRLLYGNLDLEQAARIADKISEKNIPHQLRSGGSSIYVPTEQVYELRAALARDGLGPKTGEPGYEIFDNEKLGVSPLVQKMNYNRALQGELAKTIQVFEGVEYARVHIVRPEQTVFTADAPRASASVILRLRAGWKLPSSSAAAITSLVAGAVEGLKAENVTIADSNGNLLTSNAQNDTIVAGANTYRDYKTAVEEQMTNRLLNSLEQVLGPGRATVLCSATLDMTSETTVSTTYEKGIPMEETTDNTSTVKEGITSAEGKASVPGSTEKSDTNTSKYKLPETITTRAITPGKILSWSVSAVVDLSKPAAGTEQTKTENAAAPTAAAETIMSVDDVKALIRTAIGPELIKDENLTIKNVPFNLPLAKAENVSFGYEKLDRYIEIARQSSLGLLAVCAIVALKILTGAGKKSRLAQQAEAAGQLGPASVQMLSAASGAGAAAAVRQHIAIQLRQNPEQVRQLFSTWLSEER